MDSDAARVLVVEDDMVLRTCIEDGLVDAGYQVMTAADGAGFSALVEAFRPDVALLDVMLPGASGLQLARHLREHTQASVLFLTARDAVADRLAGFDAGADDYIVKPFVMAELLARTRAVLRRSGKTRSRRLQVADLLVDEDAGEVIRDGVVIPVTATEMRLLAYLARNRGRVLSKTQILTQVWGYEAYDPNLVEAYVSGIRRKLEANGGRLIHTVRGVGYRMSETEPRMRAS
ncbi:response regulator transcription factor [Nakamurella sp. PAMC28650]|uniref:response regulator transcription factor n=1 Tax=Nakamurella sp. PAMC28650 TaxID=2762325 RepID=UPI00164E3E13|nr:response regulator transcription factor [Nakamurella sp. PAMC28650]QNK81807.1 response regulator transcription factor [Nakamurella sp. PAMC28650]